MGTSVFFFLRRFKSCNKVFLMSNLNPSRFIAPLLAVHVSSPSPRI